jgi:hypothetical protein
VLQRTSSTTLEQFALRKTGFFLVCSDVIAPREILLLEESWAKAHKDWHHFKKVLYENNLKIKNKPNLENFKLHIYTMKLSAGLLNLVRLSL